MADKKEMKMPINQDDISYFKRNIAQHHFSDEEDEENFVDIDEE